MKRIESRVAYDYQRLDGTWQECFDEKTNPVEDAAILLVRPVTYLRNVRIQRRTVTYSPWRDAHD